MKIIYGLTQSAFILLKVTDSTDLSWLQVMIPSFILLGVWFLIAVTAVCVAYWDAKH